MVFFLSASVLFLLRHHLQQRRFSLMLAGLSLAAALMTKAFVGLGILAAYAFWGFSQSKTDRLWRDLLKVAILASLSIPWFAYMTILHGNGDVLFVFRQSALLDRTLTGIEGNVKPTEILYFVNQLVVLFPLGVCFFIAGIFRTMKEGEQGWKLLALLFLVFFFTFSLIRTKLAVYLLPMLVPASLFAASELRALADNSRRSLIIFCGSAVALFWSASQEWRNSAKAVLGSITSAHIPEPEDVTNVMFFIFLSVATCTALFILSRKETWTRLLRIYPSFIFSAAFVWYGANIFYYDTVRYRDGAEGLRDFVSKSRHTSIVVAGFERNPQLTYYLDGADIGWKSDIHIRRIIPPADRNSLRSWLHDEVGAQGDRILLIVEKDKLIRYEIIDPTLIIPPGFERIFESRRYACFQREPEILLARHLAQPIKQPRQQFQIQKTPE
jgi:4-amino-4-deoxy-L-arabinose transferase-like glycosyltransferase